MSTTNSLYRLARLSADARALSSGNRKRIARRVGNHVIGRHWPGPASGIASGG